MTPSTHMVVTMRSRGVKETISLGLGVVTMKLMEGLETMTSPSRLAQMEIMIWKEATETTQSSEVMRQTISKEVLATTYLMDKMVTMNFQAAKAMTS